MFSLKTHNILDYILAFVLVICPYIFGFSAIVPANNTFLMLGVTLAVYSLLTKYYYSIARIIPIGVHMSLDVALGLMALVAPYIFDYRNQISNMQYLVHVVLGVGAIGLVALTRTRTEDAKTPEERFETETFQRPSPANPLR